MDVCMIISRTNMLICAQNFLLLKLHPLLFINTNMLIFYSYCDLCEQFNILKVFISRKSFELQLGFFFFVKNM